MNLAKPLFNPASSRQWNLWVAPTHKTLAELRNRPSFEQSRTLLMHPKDWDRATQAIETALESQLYNAITLPKSRFNLLAQQKLSLIAIRSGTELNWVGQGHAMNTASQLDLF